MNSERCRVSVIIPVFNSATTLRRAAGSVVRQTLRDWEMLIVDDGSADDSAAIARAIAASEPRARLIGFPVNRGKPQAMNFASVEARGEWIAVLDADDEYDPRRLEALVAAAEANRADVVADNQLLYDAGARRTVGLALPREAAVRRLPAAEFIARCDPYAAFDYGMLKPLVRTAFLRDCGVRYREDARLSEDFLFLAELFAAGADMILVPEPYYLWTQAFGTISRSWTTTGAGAWRYDFGSAVRAHLAVQSELLRRDETELAALLGRRARAFRRLMWLDEINRARAGGAPPRQLAAILMRHPTILPAVAWRALRRANHQFLVRDGARARERSGESVRVLGAGH